MVKYKVPVERKLPQKHKRPNGQPRKEPKPRSFTAYVPLGTGVLEWLVSQSQS